MRSRIVWVMAALLPACGGDGGTFSGVELAAIRAKLGPLPAVPADPTNRFADDPAAAALGQELFFDARYSSNGQVSCATCHDPAHGFQDDRANTSQGLGFTARHATTVINSAYGAADPTATVWEFWDGRRDSLWAQALTPPESDVEMGGTRAGIAFLIYDHYRSEYEAIFGPMPVLRDGGGAPLFPATAKPGQAAWDALSPADQAALTGVYVNFGKAIAAYERLIVSRNSRFDRFYAELAQGASDSDLLDAEEKLGLRLFLGKGACLECHGGPNFTDWKFHNIGLEQTGPNVAAVDEGRAAGVDGVLADEFNCASAWSDQPNKTACAVNLLAPQPEDLGAFKTPSLRSVAQTAPYMHTGMLATLDEVVAHYDDGGDPSGFVGTIDPKIRVLGLTPAERAAVVAFLRTLDGEPLDPSLTTAPVLP